MLRQVNCRVGYCKVLLICGSKLCLVDFNLLAKSRKTHRIYHTGYS